MPRSARGWSWMVLALLMSVPAWSSAALAPRTAVEAGDAVLRIAAPLEGGFTFRVDWARGTAAIGLGGGEPAAGCVGVGTSAPFEGWAVAPPGPCSPDVHPFHAGGFASSVLACESTYECTFDGLNEDGSWVLLHCKPGGAVAGDWPDLRPTPFCDASAGGQPPGAWTLWDAYAGGPGSLAAIAAAHLR